MITKMQPARNPAGEVPEVLSGKYKTGELIVNGTVMTQDANGELIVAAADPTRIVGVALEAAASKPGYDAANSPTVVTGRVQEVSYAVANADGVFTARAETAGVLTAPLQANVGVRYGIVKNGTEWRIDLSDVAATRLVIVDVDITNGVWFFRWLPSALAQA